MSGAETDVFRGVMCDSVWSRGRLVTPRDALGDNEPGRKPKTPLSLGNMDTGICCVSGVTPRNRNLFHENILESITMFAHATRHSIE